MPYSIPPPRPSVRATTPFAPEDLRDLRGAAADVLKLRFPACAPEYERRGWKLPTVIDRVYVNERARRDLGWQPRYDFAHAVAALRGDEDPSSPLARVVGSKGYHRPA